VAIIRALSQPFQMLLMDEPFSHLDERNIDKAIELIETTCTKNNAGWMLSTLGNTYSLNFDHLVSL
jgi:ABC-type nitrate/sulfonate/bicarbonate transport system ATPase subunit